MATKSGLVGRRLRPLLQALPVGRDQLGLVAARFAGNEPAIVDAAKFARITRVANGYDNVRAGITAARKAGLDPVKVNCVLLRGFNDDQIPAFGKFFLTLPLAPAQTDLYVEMVGLVRPGDGVSFDVVQLYR